MITERAVDGVIEIKEDGVITVRRDTVIDRDGKEIVRLFAVLTLIPGQDVSTLPLRLRRICNLIWDAQTIADYRARQSVII